MDELLQPTLQGPLRRPWNPSGYIWYAILGGMFALAVHAVRNSERMFGPGHLRTLIVMTVGVVAVLAAPWVLPTGEVGDLRTATRLIAVATALPVVGWHRRGARAVTITGRSFASWRDDIGVTIGVVLLQAAYLGVAHGVVQ